MATYELYVGGPASGNASRAMYPRPAFNANLPVFANMKAAAHKNAQMFALTRVLDFKNDTAMRNWNQQLEADGTPLVVGDDLGILIVPARTLLFGFEVNVVNPVEGLTLGFNVRGGAFALPTIDATTAGARFAAPGGAFVANGTVSLATACYIGVPTMIEVEIDAIGYEGMGDLRLEVTALIAETRGGEF